MTRVLDDPVLPRRVRIREVGPRDGLQAEEPVSVERRIELIDALSRTGVAEIEAVSFVSPRAVPAMAGAAEVMKAIDRADGVRYVGLVPNVRGAELALEAGVDGLSVTVSASEEYSQRNVRRSIEESLDELRSICRLVEQERPGMWIDTVISCAYGSPYEGEIDPGEVGRMAGEAMDTGSTSLTLADTTGMATPRGIRDVARTVGTNVRLHLHDTRGTALVNAYAALEIGIVDFDTSVGGLGGSPFAEGAGGNLATEDLVHLLDDIGVETGIELDRMLECSALVADIVGHDVASHISAAGPRSRQVPA